jgi:hypothetical protein
MVWSFDHPISFGVVFLAIMLVLFVFGIAPLVLRDAKAGPQLASSMASIVIAVLIGVFLNNILQGGRAREARVASLRVQHLSQLRPVLKAESQSLQTLVNALQSQGHLASVRPDPVNDPINLDGRIWPETMSPDLRNHFLTYDDAKRALFADTKQQEEEFRSTISVLANSISDKRLPDEWKENVSLSFVQKCMGVNSGMLLRVNPSGGTRFLMRVAR